MYIDSLSGSHYQKGVDKFMGCHAQSDAEQQLEYMEETGRCTRILIPSICKKDSTFLDFNYHFGKKGGKNMLLRSVETVKFKRRWKASAY